MFTQVGWLVVLLIGAEFISDDAWHAMRLEWGQIPALTAVKKARDTLSEVIPVPAQSSDKPGVIMHSATALVSYALTHHPVARAAVEELTEQGQSVQILLRTGTDGHKLHSYAGEVLSSPIIAPIHVWVTLFALVLICALIHRRGAEQFEDC